DRLPELQALLRVLEAMLVGAHLRARDLPRGVMASAAQHVGGIAKRPLASLETIRVRHAAILQRDLAVLDDLQRHLVLHLLDDEAGDLVVVDVARPDDRDVAPRRIADPALLAIENPAVAIALRGGQ